MKYLPFQNRGLGGVLSLAGKKPSLGHSYSRIFPLYTIRGPKDTNKGKDTLNRQTSEV